MSIFLKQIIIFNTKKNQHRKEFHTRDTGEFLNWRSNLVIGYKAKSGWNWDFGKSYN